MVLPHKIRRLKTIDIPTNEDTVITVIFTFVASIEEKFILGRSIAISMLTVSRKYIKVIKSRYTGCNVDTFLTDYTCMGH